MLRKYGKFFILAAILLGIAVGWYFLPLKEWTQSFGDYARSLGAMGVLIFAAIYILATVLVMPVSFLTIASGLAYGFWGIPIVLISATVGACLAFLLGRKFLRERIKEYIADKPKFKAARESVNKDGWKVAGLLRLSPAVPFNVQNYLLGVTEISFLKYAATTFVGIAPGTALYVYIGTLGASASEASELKLGFLIVGLIASIIVVFLIQRKVSALLKTK